MKSICIKTNNQEIIKYLIDTFEKLPINCCISNYRFKKFDNLIIHDLDRNINAFCEIVALVLKSTVEKYYEKEILKKIIKRNYFYLDEIEQEYVFEISNQIMHLSDNKIGFKRQLLKDIFLKYLICNKSIVLDGFINFRIKDYKDLLEKIVEASVVSFLELTSF